MCSKDGPPNCVLPLDSHRRLPVHRRGAVALGRQSEVEDHDKLDMPVERPTRSPKEIDVAADALQKLEMRIHQSWCPSSCIARNTVRREQGSLKGMTLNM